MLAVCAKIDCCWFKLFHRHPILSFTLTATNFRSMLNFSLKRHSMFVKGLVPALLDPAASPDQEPTRVMESLGTCCVLLKSGGVIVCSRAIFDESDGVVYGCGCVYEQCAQVLSSRVRLLSFTNTPSLRGIHRPAPCRESASQLRPDR
jgi:hypothetical protein